MVTEAERKRIEGELDEILAALIAGCEALDLEAAFRRFTRSPEFLMLGSDGSACDFATFFANNRVYLKTCSRFRLTTLTKTIRVFERDLALLAWTYRAEATLKTGETEIVERAAASFVFRRVIAAWQVVFYHESGLPPARVPSA